MRGQSFWVVLVAVVAVCTGHATQAQEIEAASRIESVTLYRDQALVVRSVKAAVPAGVTELVVKDLPPQVLGESLFANADEAANVRAVRFRTRAVQEEPREEIRQIEQEIEGLQAQVRRSEAMGTVATERKQYLGKLENFAAPTAQMELTKGVLDAKTLQSLTLFLFEQRDALAEELLRIETEQADLSKQISLLQRRRAELTKGTSRTLREAVVFVDRKEAGEVELRVSYLVRQAGWQATHNLRANGDGANVTVEYNATAYQMSGEDWENVQLTLSTAYPALLAKGPEPAPFWVTLAQAGETPDTREIAARAKRYQQELRKGELFQQQSLEVGAELDANWRMNTAASGLQSMEITAPKATLGQLRLRDAAATEGLSVTYPLPGRISLESRSDRQMVQIASLKLNSEFYYVATPLLTSYVYREAEVANDSDVALLEGDATCYLDGRFVGRSRVPLVARGQRFRTGFGMNSQLRSARELVEKTDRTLGGNRQQSLHYRLILENYSEEPVNVRIYDRVPMPMEGTEIRLTLGEMEDKLSEDPLYLQRERPQGILRWDIEVPAKATGPDARKVGYQYTLEFDRELAIVTPTEGGRASEAKEQFEVLMEERFLSH